MKFVVLAAVLGLSQAFNLKVDGEMLGQRLADDEGHSYAEKQRGAEYSVNVHKFAKGSPGACRTGDTAKITYTGKFADGSVFDSTDKSNFGMPMKFLIGSGQVIPCLESAFL